MELQSKSHTALVILHKLTELLPKKYRAYPSVFVHHYAVLWYGLCIASSVFTLAWNSLSYDKPH